jgi:hypothetical protein
VHPSRANGHADHLGPSCHARGLTDSPPGCRPAGDPRHAPDRLRPSPTARASGHSTDQSEPARTLVGISDGTDTAWTIEQGRLFETTSTLPHDTPLIGADPEANGLVPLGPAFEEEIAHATQLTIEKEALK